MNISTDKATYQLHDVGEGDFILHRDGERIGKVRDLVTYEGLTNSSMPFTIFLGKTSGSGRWMNKRYETLELASISLANKYEKVAGK